MTIATLVKVVPELDRMTFDPDTKTMRRSGAPLELNPFDEHAALVAASLKTPDESAILVCMGPPDAKPSIIRALALGSDRAMLVSDRALAGSDTCATSHALAAALRPLAPDLVLAGRWSTDSSTGQLTSQVAERLDLPLVGAARQISRKSKDSLEVVSETESGWVKYEVGTPCLVTVTEKIGKIRFAKPKQLEDAAAKPFEIRGIRDLGVRPEDVGLAGSPTLVLSLENEEPPRTPLILDEETPDERVRKAVARIRELLARARAAPPALRPPEGSADGTGEVLVLASSEGGGLDRDALPLVSEVLRLPEPLWPSVVGFGPLSPDDEATLARAGATRAYWSRTDPGWVAPVEAARAVVGVVADHPKLAGALFLSTGWAREVAGRVSGRLLLGLTGDAVAVSWDPRWGMVFHKPSFGGGLVAKVVSKHPPSLATIRPGSLAPGSLTGGTQPLVVDPVPMGRAAGRLSRVGSGVEKDPRFGDLDHARIVVSVGMGIGGPKNVETILEVIRPLGAALGASRRVVDSGWVPYQLQVGLTGKSIAPDLYVAIGISGQVNHLVGVKRARVTVGINSKPREPLFSRVDVGILGDGLDLLRRLAPLIAELPEVAVPVPPGS